MTTDLLLIGQGITGTWLSYYLEKYGVPHLVIDAYKENSPSRVASGVINPITGRRMVKTWRIDELLPFAFDAYTEMGATMDQVPVRKSRIIDQHVTPQMKLAFEDRMREEPQYVARPQNENDYLPFFHYELGYGIIEPVLLLDIHAVLNQRSRQLEANGQLIRENFDWNQVQLKEEGIQYGDITAKHIIFCDGLSAFTHPLFKNLPFAASKGEALWIEAPELPDDVLVKKGMSLVPWSPGVFWVGSTYEWEFDTTEPTQQFYTQTEAHLKQWLKVPFRILDHKAAIRPATLERRPFVGFHPLEPRVGLFNGMGTKGCSLAPFFARQFVLNYLNGEPIYPEAELKRFTKVLSRSLS